MADGDKRSGRGSRPGVYGEGGTPARKPSRAGTRGTATDYISTGSAKRRVEESPGAPGSAREPRPTHPEGTVFVGGSPILPGTRRRVDLPVAKLPTGQSMSMPVIVVNGAKPGPAVWLSAAIHGDELNGIEIIRRVLTGLVPSTLAGDIYTVPVVNAFGFINDQRYLPDRRDLNRSFPGSKSGSLAARIANLFMEAIAGRCTIGIDLHTGSGGRTNYPQVRINGEDEEAVRLARVFAPPSIIYGSTRPGTLRAAASKRGAHVLVYEAGEASRFDAKAIEAGTDGVLRVLQNIGMIADAPEPAEPTFESSKTEWVRASRSGLAQFWVPLGARVKRRQPLGIVTDTCGEITSTISAPSEGMVIGLAVNPHAYRGDALVHIGLPMT